MCETHARTHIPSNNGAQNPREWLIQMGEPEQQGAEEQMTVCKSRSVLASDSQGLKNFFFISHYKKMINELMKKRVIPGQKCVHGVLDLGLWLIPDCVPTYPSRWVSPNQARQRLAPRDARPFCPCLLASLLVHLKRTNSTAGPSPQGDESGDGSSRKCLPIILLTPSPLLAH